MFDLIPERIRSRIAICPETGCWLWTGSDSGKGRGGGYGRVKYEGHTWAVHKLIYWLVTGLRCWSKQLDHTCETRSCCNPAHLEPVTNLENQRRKWRRRMKARRRETPQEITA